MFAETPNDKNIRYSEKTKRKLNLNLNNIFFREGFEGKENAANFYSRVAQKKKFTSRSDEAVTGKYGK